MIMRKIQIVLLLLIGSLSLSSCFNIEEVEISEIKSVKLLELNDNGLLVESEIRILNPNNYDIKVVDSDFNVAVNDRKIGKAKILSKLTIPASSNDLHTVKLQSEHEDLLATAIPNLIAITATGKDRLAFKVDGFIVGKVWWIKKKVKVAHEGKVDLELF